MPNQTGAPNYYSLLGLHPSASPQQIRRAYRELSKLYHPDTTELPSAIATAKFQQLNEAYATISNPERRSTYDRKIGYSRIHVMQAPADLNRPVSQARRTYSSSAYLDPTDRPLSPGEVFALFILGLTFVACLVLAIAIGLTRGEFSFHPLQAKHSPSSTEEVRVSLPPAVTSEAIEIPPAENTLTAPSAAKTLAPVAVARPQVKSKDTPDPAINIVPTEAKTANPAKPNLNLR